MKHTRKIGRLLVLLLVLAISVTTVSAVAVSAFAEEITGDDFDIVFFETVKELATSEYDVMEIIAAKQLVCDLSLNPLGYVYDFTVNDNNGYAIVIDDGGIVEVAEFFEGTLSPYADLQEEATRVYVCYLTFLYATDDGLFVVGGDLPLSDEAIALLSEKAYCGSAITTSDETISYVAKTVSSKNLAFRHPIIPPVGGLNNACAVLAGTALVQYWDYYCTELIPNYTPASLLAGNIIYKSYGNETTAVAQQLYIDMGTDSAGTTITEFKTGMQTYCARQGYRVTFSSCMSLGKFNYATAKQKLESGTPIVLFVDTFTIATTITENAESKYDRVYYIVGNGAHVMAGFGYREISYVLSNGSTRTDTYIAVSGGLNEARSGYYNTSLNTQIDDAYGVVIS